MVTKEDQDWLNRMAKAFRAVDDWERWAERVHLVHRPSDLAQDDRLCPEFATSRTAVHGISSAVDHLALFRDAVRETETTRPYAYYTLARAATFAALRSVWILSPQYRKKRQERGLWIEYDNISKFIALVTSLREPKTISGLRSIDRTLEDAQRRKAVIVGAGAKLGVTINKKNKPQDTRILQEATAWIDRHADPDAFGAGNGMMLLWRIHSGAAHSLSWINQGKAEVVGPLPSGGYEGRVTATVEDMGLAVSSATLATSEAMKLLDRRSTRNHHR